MAFDEFILCMMATAFAMFIVSLLQDALRQIRRLKHARAEQQALPDRLPPWLPGRH